MKGWPLTQLQMLFCFSILIYLSRKDTAVYTPTHLLGIRAFERLKTSHHFDPPIENT